MNPVACRPNGLSPAGASSGKIGSIPIQQCALSPQRSQDETCGSNTSHVLMKLTGFKGLLLMSASSLMRSKMTYATCM
jgi:hypothetical protein